MPTNYAQGHMAEEVAAQYLEKQGFRVQEVNWKTRWCEIDIVASKNTRVYFVEVKYRKSNSQGNGADYITTKKLQQMGFAAALWVAEHKWDGEYQLSVIEMTGDNFEVVNFFEDL